MKVSGFTSQIQYIFGAVLLAFLLAFPLVSSAQATNECSFNRTLEMGVDGEDVRCLQKYLNASGFQIAESGPGAPGGETSLYRTLTKEAVQSWQKAKGVSPTSGVFGPKSQAAYLLDLVVQLEAQKPLAAVTTLPTPTPQPIVAGASTDADTEDRKDTERVLKSVMDMVMDTYKELQAVRKNNPEEAENIDEDLRDVIEAFFDALELYFDGDYKNAIVDADEILDDATNALEDAQGQVDVVSEKDANKAVEDAWDEYKDAKDKINNADDDGDNVGDAYDYLKDAKNLLNDAEDALDDEDWDGVIDLVEEALDEIDNALDEL